MDSKELRGLMEAYSEVYAPQEVDEATAMAKRGYDETKLRKPAGGGEAADRASALEKKSTFGDANKEKQRQTYARAQRRDFRNTASSNPGLHVGQHKSDDPEVKAKQAARGAQRGALTPAEKKQFNREEFVVDEGKLPLDKERRDRIGRQIGRRTYSSSPKKYDQMDKMSGALKSAQKTQNNEEFDTFDAILEFLYMEGFAETLEEAEWMMANIIDEEAIDIILGEEQLDEVSLKTKMSAFKKRATDEFESDGDNPRNYTKSGASKADKTKENIVKKHGEKAGQHAERAAHTGIFGRKSFSMPKKPEKTRKEEFEAWLDEAMTNYEKNRKRAAQRAAARNDARAQGKTGAVPGVGYVTPRKERETWTDESGKTRHAKGL